MKVHQDPISNGTGLDEKKNVYMIFSAYYHNQLWNQADLDQVIDILRDYADAQELNIETSLKEIQMSSEETRKEALYDFSKMFIGPDQLIVPPYESVYVNHDRLVMTESTLKVREFYDMCGIEIEAKGKYPEDHMAFELEFMAYLYHKVIQNGSGEYRIRQFLRAHLSKWYREHLNEVEEKAKTDYCKAWAVIIRTVLEKDISDSEQEWKGGL